MGVEVRCFFGVGDWWRGFGEISLLSGVEVCEGCGEKVQGGEVWDEYVD